MVGHDGEGGRGRDERDGVVVLSIGGARQRSVGGDGEQLHGVVDVLTDAFVQANDGPSRQQISASVRQ